MFMKTQFMSPDCHAVWHPCRLPCRLPCSSLTTRKKVCTLYRLVNAMRFVEDLERYCPAASPAASA